MAVNMKKKATMFAKKGALLTMLAGATLLGSCNGDKDNEPTMTPTEQTTPNTPDTPGKVAEPVVMEIQAGIGHWEEMPENLDEILKKVDSVKFAGQYNVENRYANTVLKIYKKRIGDITNSKLVFSGTTLNDIAIESDPKVIAAADSLIALGFKCNWLNEKEANDLLGKNRITVLQR